jgi:glutathione synthase/RimK-type ligase-like ATP-grasp enzyme
LIVVSTAARRGFEIEPCGVRPLFATCTEVIVILLLSADNDPHALRVHDRLVAHNADVLWFDPGEFPAQAEIAVRIGKHGVRRTIFRRGGDIDLERVTAVWYRRPSGPTPLPGVHDGKTTAYVVEECDNLVVTLFDSLDCLVVPGPRPVYRRAESKIAQLLHAVAVGMDVPETLTCTSPGEFLEFFRTYRDDMTSMISKTCSGVASRAFGQEEFFRFTERVGLRDAAYAWTLRHAPATFQSYIDKDVELRVTIVGDRVFAAEIHSQVSRQTRQDWRHYDHLNTPIRPHDLPAEVAEQCRAITRRMGVCYGAMDLIRTTSGRYVFIENNPNGQYLWIEDETSLPISDAICDLLQSGRRRSDVRRLDQEVEAP